ncbi:MAG: hypothetical protein J7L95_00785 [Prolixibacteraceae bacterium]|nr:hypothetical protein [Prolixibacteraceae bacterium]
MTDKIQLPLTFNPYKHHFKFLRAQVAKWKKTGWEVAEPTLRTIGNNLLDFYIGKLTVEQICNECLTFFHKNQLLQRDNFYEWLRNEKYKKIQLSDHSDWIVKRGTDAERFIHIHPAKYSSQTLRVRAKTLKTVLILQIFSVPIRKNKLENLKAVNHFRKNYLLLSPVKTLRHGKGILLLWELFQQT